MFQTQTKTNLLHNGFVVLIAIKFQIEKLFIINESDIDFVEETVSAENADGKTFVLGEIDGCFPFEIRESDRDFVSVSRKTSFCRADVFLFAFFNLDAEQIGVKSLENTKSASRVEFDGCGNRIFGFFRDNDIEIDALRVVGIFDFFVKSENMRHFRASLR